VKKALGTHVLVEMFGCDPATLKDKEFVGKVLIRSAEEANAHIVATYFHQFQPYGVSGAVIIEESHFTIHTWPEHGFAAVDLFYCSDDVDVEKAIEILVQEFRPASITTFEVKRGVLPELNLPMFSPGEEKETVELANTALAS